MTDDMTNNEQYIICLSPLLNDSPRLLSDLIKYYGIDIMLFINSSWFLESYRKLKDHKINDYQKIHFIRPVINLMLAREGKIFIELERQEHCEFAENNLIDDAFFFKRIVKREDVLLIDDPKDDRLNNPNYKHLRYDLYIEASKLRNRQLPA